MVDSDDLGSIIRRVRVTAPRCVAGAAPRLEAGEAAAEGEQFGTCFWLGCHCGCRETAVLGYPAVVRGEVVILSMLAVECPARDRVTEIFVRDLLGYDPG